MAGIDQFERIEITTAMQWRAWLEAHHQQEESVWLVTYLKHTGDRYVPYPDLLDEALCFGWIDGAGRKLDDERTMRLFSPRQTQHWAKTYKDRVARLTQQGRMHPAGFAAIERSKQLGLWDYMADVDALEMPDDLASALQGHPPALENFSAFALSYRRNILRWIKIAKTPETRAKRVGETTLRAANNEKVPQWG